MREATTLVVEEVGGVVEVEGGEEEVVEEETGDGRGEISDKGPVFIYERI